MPMEKEIPKDYYIKRKPRLLKQFDKVFNFGKGPIIKKFGENKTEEIIKKMRDEYEGLIPHIPYIGGNRYEGTATLINSTYMLLVFRVLEREGLKIYEIGELAYEIYETFYKSTAMPAEQLFKEEYIAIRKKETEETQLRRYPEDWVIEFVEGDGNTFDYGLNYLECAVCKFYKQQKAEHYLPYICLADYATARASGYGLRRSQTIANGAPICDFHFIKNGQTPRGWPPDNLEEFKSNL